MRSPVAILLLAALALPGAAGAHGTGTHSGLVNTVVGTEPLVPGLLARVLRTHERIALRNLTTQRVVVFDRAQRPLVRLGPGDAKTWVDPRITWTGPLPKEQKLLRNWRIPGEIGGTPFEIVGFLGYVPPPGEPSGTGTSPWLIAGAVTAGLLALAALGLVGARLARRAPTP